jgi:2-keto-4-pentenoate hydratase/2-oxohepta-3-ene-1,7-dioic acid hydratase in catechol pathway
MKYCRFQLHGQLHYGVVEERDGEPWITASAHVPPEDFSYRLAHVLAAGARLSFAPLPLRSARLLPPVTPGKIICVGSNYRAHVLEMGHELPTEPLLFFKPVSSLLESGGVVRMPAASTRVDFEGELALVIGSHAHKLKAEDWRSALRGYTLANDVTARDLQTKDSQWSRAKGFDTFCPVGPFVSDEIDLDAGLDLSTRVNGEVRQSGSTLDFIFPVPELLAYISSIFTLEPGDLILTGTPSGIGPLQPGDKVEIAIPGLGVLANTFQPEEE